MLSAILIFCLVYNGDARIHKLKVEGDSRSSIDMSTFGFLKGGYMSVNMITLSLGKSPSKDKVPNNTIGFTLEKTMSLGLSTDNENMNNMDCQLKKFEKKENESIIYFLLDLDRDLPVIHVKRQGELSQLKISLEKLDQPPESEKTETRIRRSPHYLRDSYLMNPRHRQRRDGDTEAEKENKLEQVPPKKTLKIKAQKLPASAVKSPPDDSKPLTSATKDNIETPVLPDSLTKTATTGKTEPSKENPAKDVPENKEGLERGKEEQEDEEEDAPEDEEIELSEEENKDIKEETNKTPKEETDQTSKEETNTPSSTPKQYLTNDTIPVTKMGPDKYSFFFVLWIDTDGEEGLYNFFFHNCAQGSSKRPVNFTMFMAERNNENYLSAGEMPLPTLYFVLCLVHVSLAIIWLYILRTSTEGVYKLHYMMLALLFVKSLALLFHGLNFYFIQLEGHHEEAFAVLYYITYLMRGMLLFVTILLIGAGWAFIKHVLSSREKRIFLIVIPLQILSNVAQIIIEETEEGQSDYQVWKEVLIAVDLICCGAILFPVVWSIRHLQWASQTDGKAAINLQKLKLFRHFYIMIVCYIYFSRIIVILVNITVPFRYEWIQELFKEVTTLIFFTFTGYKFRPASNNPYLQVPSDDEDDMEMDSVVSGHSGVLEGLTRVNQSVNQSSGGANSVPAAAGAAGASGECNGTAPKQREASHEYD